MKKPALIVAVAALVALAGTAWAMTTLDTANGTGFVGKGDVQVPFGWNNATLQANANNLVFGYADQVEYDVPCMKEAGRQVLRNTFDRKRTVSAAVEYDARRRNQVNGFILTGFGAETVEGNVACPGGWEPDGDPVLVGSTGGTLTVTNAAGGVAVLWTTDGGSVHP